MSADQPSTEQSRIKELEAELAKYKAREELINKFFGLELYKLGQAFFDKTVLLLAELLEVDYAFIGRLEGLKSVTTTSLCVKGEIAPNFTYELEHTPCSNVIDFGPCIYESGVSQLFPKDELLVQMGVDSYVGVPLFNTDCKPLGILVLLHNKPIRNPKLVESFLLMFAGRASAELEHHDHALELQTRNEQLVIAKQQAEESDRLKTAFLANMSHEIRTPMNAIIGFSSLLEDPENTGEERDEYLSHIKERSEDLLKLVDDVIDLSRIEANAVELTSTPIELIPLLQKAAAQQQKLAARKRTPLRVNLELAPDLPQTVNADKGALNQCLNNLLSNSLKFTDKGSITIAAERNGDTLELSVADTGPGVSPEHAKQIFERFMQADNSATRLHGGSGLGLAITKSLIELMGGQVTVETTDQRESGALFRIHLPINEAENSATQTQSTAPFATQSVKKTKLLVVEDDEFNQVVITKLLQKDGADVSCVASAADALEFCKSNPDTGAVFMDVHMPGGSGLDCTRELKKLYPQLPVIIQSASVFDRDRANAKDAGADAFLAKPMSREALRECLTAIGVNSN
ncbi:GAF domain-containing hybrid sensor histidine kinase/response regulator [Pelagicoccus mobilis]|uniref:histidine kinase n=1 Tax=Pelagicoccus mobilis TaxID=415221 RepID=A0A934RRK4_9BACT|nr:GAF domain-containing hybrid sensor histidine kinase/response regulator [Pelagicoccus mobilis]MBK1876265.1 response regulator [Pelagicoccus mobilis]